MVIRIGLVFNRYRSDGGTERITQDVFGSLAAADVQWYVLTRSWGGEKPANVQFIECKAKGIGRSRKWACFTRHVERRITELNVDFVQTQIPLRNAHIFRADGGTHIEWLQQRQRQATLMQRLWRRLGSYNRLRLGLERAMYASDQLQAVICVSEMVRDDILRHYPQTRARLHVIPNGVHIDRFAPDDRRLAQGQAVRSELGIGGQDTVFVFIGSGFERKGLACAIRALAKNATAARLLVVGRDKKARAYQRLARQLGIASRVHFVGPQEDVRPYLWAADALVHPALYEPFGLIVIEALAAGVPVLASDHTGAALSVVHDTQTGAIFDALDTDALATAMQRLAQQTTTERQASKQACMMAAAPYSMTAMRTRLLDFYRNFNS